MAKKKQAQAQAPEGSSTGPSGTAKTTTAKAAFDEYKRRLEAGAYERTVKGHPAGASGMKHPSGMPPYPFPPQFYAHQPSVGMTYPYATPGPFGFQSQSSMSGGSLFENLAVMMRLGVELLNAALAGGAQMVGGFSGGPGFHGMHYGHHGGAPCCHEPSGHHDCCWSSCCQCDCCCSGDCCRPGVHGCC